jgi:hypothetical protein
MWAIRRALGLTFANAEKAGDSVPANTPAEVKSIFWKVRLFINVFASYKVSVHFDV